MGFAGIQLFTIGMGAECQRGRIFGKKSANCEHYECSLGVLNCMLWEGVGGCGLYGNHHNVESSGTRCYLKTQEKDDLNDFIEIYSHKTDRPKYYK